MQAGINQWSLPVEDRDLLSILQLSVKSGIPNIELCIEPVGADSFGKLETDPELNEIFLNVARAVNAKKYLLGLLDSNAVLDTLKTTILKAGARVASVTTLDLFRYTLTSNDGKTREAASWIIKKMVDICAYMGGKIVLIEPGVVTSSLSYSDAYRNCEATMRDLAKYAEERNILLALENVWGKFLMSPLEFRALIDGTHSEAVGAYFDVANILEYGYPQDWIRILGGRIKSIHFKDYRLGAGIHGFCNPFDGDVDWFSVKRALEQTRYQGNIVAEIIKPKAWQEQFITELGRKLDYFIHEL
jgi:L-ribulose-5-phosphate 3-epimerase